MILAIDVGNTNITIGGFEKDELKQVIRIATDATKTEDEYASKIHSVLHGRGIHKDAIQGAIIASVVPPLNAVIRQAIEFTYGITPLLVGPGIKTGIKIHCDDPASVGADLICACVATHFIYGSPSLTVDMGTATKILLMNGEGAFCGASIGPGVLMGLKSLASGTAQLPQISLEAPKSVIGKNTVDCMRSGVIFGNAALIDGMIDRYNAEMGVELPVYATGGYAKTVTKHCKHNIQLDNDLVLKGLYILYQKNV